MKQFLFQVLALTAVIIAGFILTSKQPLFNKNTGNDSGNQTGNGMNKLQIIDPQLSSGGLTKASINIEIADTKEKRTKGLGERQSLASDSGMLFIFEKSDQYTFWMKGLTFPLDFIWISNNQVVDLTSNVPQPNIGQKDDTLLTYRPSVKVDKVLEVNAGFISDHNVKLGDKIELK